MEKAQKAPSHSANIAILDTSIYVHNFRSGKYESQLLQLNLVVRASAVVLAELSRGARSEEELNFVQTLSKNLKIITPTERDWLKSGEIVRSLSIREAWETHKIRKIHFDVLIALTARRAGAALITNNVEDFRAIRNFIPFQLIEWN